MNCNICPQNCNINRDAKTGICQNSNTIRISKYMKHMWEEPVISGQNGSGTIFFSGCNLKCVFCQNYKISHENKGYDVSVYELSDIFIELQSEGVHNINLVTPTHFMPQIVEVIKLAKEKGLKIPIVYNSNGYEKVETLKLLDGYIDIYLPDIKYFSDQSAEKYSKAKNYFDTAKLAVLEMYRQVKEPIINDGIMEKGLIIRHLVLPGLRQDSMRILDFVKENCESAYISLMSQYIPCYNAVNYKEINRKLTTLEYNSVVDYFFKIGLKNGFMQSKTSAKTDYIPEF